MLRRITESVAVDPATLEITSCDRASLVEALEELARELDRASQGSRSETDEIEPERLLATTLREVGWITAKAPTRTRDRILGPLLVRAHELLHAEEIALETSWAAPRAPSQRSMTLRYLGTE